MHKINFAFRLNPIRRVHKRTMLPTKISSFLAFIFLLFAIHGHAVEGRRERKLQYNYYYGQNTYYYGQNTGSMMSDYSALRHYAMTRESHGMWSSSKKSSHPSASPSALPSAGPTQVPSASPSAYPSASPSSTPSQAPTRKGKRQSMMRMW